MKAPLSIAGCGAVTAAGLTARQTCAAIRAGVSGITDAYHRAPPDDPLLGGRIPASSRLRATASGWLGRLAARAIAESISASPDTGRIGVIMNIPESKRDHPAFDRLSPRDFMESILAGGRSRYAAAEFVREGHAGMAPALEQAANWIESGKVDACCVGGVDSLLNPRDIQRLTKSYRIRLPEQSWGLMPAEGAACVLLTQPTRSPSSLATLSGLGRGQEPDTVLGARYSRGTGLQNALAEAIASSGSPESSVGFRISDVNGERYSTLESVLTEARFYRTRREQMPLWLTAPSVGDMGAASGALSLVVASIALSRGYAPGRVVMCEASSDSGLRSACLLEAAAPAR